MFPRFAFLISHLYIFSISCHYFICNHYDLGNKIALLIAARVFYSVTYTSTPNVVVINRDTGALRLLSSLSSVTSEKVNVTVRAFDGLHEQVARVTIHIVDQNTNAPSFTKGTYSISVKESTVVGTTVLRVSAEDADSSELAFSVVSGNTGNVFSLKPLSGTALCNSMGSQKAYANQSSLIGYK